MKTFKKLVSGLKSYTEKPSHDAAFGSIGNREDVHVPKADSYSKENFAFMSIHKGDHTHIGKDDVNEDKVDFGDMHFLSQHQELHNQLNDLHSKHIENTDVDNHIRGYSYSGTSRFLNSNLVQMHMHDADPNDHNTVRKFLRSTGKSDQEIDHHLEYDKGLTRILSTAPKLHRGIDVYTGVGRDFDIGKQRELHGDRVHLPAFTSTSLDEGMAHQFAMRGNKKSAEVVKIHIPEGSQHGAYIADKSRHGHELEFLLNRGRKLKFHGEPEQKGNFVYHHATLED